MGRYSTWCKSRLYKLSEPGSVYVRNGKYANSWGLVDLSQPLTGCVVHTSSLACDYQFACM